MVKNGTSRVLEKRRGIISIMFGSLSPGALYNRRGEMREGREEPINELREVAFSVQGMSDFIYRIFKKY